MHALSLSLVCADAVLLAQEHASRDGGGAGPLPAPNPLLMGQTPEAAVLKALAGVRANELEQALLLLPYTDALRLLTYLCHWLRKGLQVCLLAELACLLYATSTPSR